MDDPRVHASGIDADRVLLFGSGPSVGWGVISHDLALPGALARALTSLTGRGTDIDVHAHSAFRVGNSERELADIDLARYDAIVLTLGLTEVVGLASVSEWERDLTTVLDYVAGRTSEQTRIFVVGVHALTRITTFDALVAPLVGAQRQRLNRVSERACAHMDRVTYIEFNAPPSLDRNRYRTRAQYREAAALLAPAIALALDRGFTAPASVSSTWGQLTGVDEETRHLSLERLHILDTDREERFDRLTEFAKRAFHATSAAITLIDHDRFWVKSGAGTSATEGDRNQAICVTTIGRSGPLIVSDATVDPRFAHMTTPPGVPQTRFYAGFPIEAPDGIAVGTLCVFDPVARDVDNFDRALLRDIALMAQRELWVGITAPALAATE